MFSSFLTSFWAWNVLISHRPEQARISRVPGEIHYSGTLSNLSCWTFKLSSILISSFLPFLASSLSSWLLVLANSQLFNIQETLRSLKSFYSFLRREATPCVPHRHGLYRILPRRMNTAEWLNPPLIISSPVFEVTPLPNSITFCLSHLSYLSHSLDLFCSW